MTQETGAPSNVSEEIQKQWEEMHQEAIRSRQRYLERAKHVGASLDATLVAITGFPPGIQSDPAVYKSNRDASYFMVAGKKGEVARDTDPEEIRKHAQRLYSVPLDYSGDYAIVRFDFKRRIEEGGLFYTPEGYVELKRYNPDTDPSIFSGHGNTPSPTT